MSDKQKTTSRKAAPVKPLETKSTATLAQKPSGSDGSATPPRAHTHPTKPTHRSPILWVVVIVLLSAAAAAEFWTTAETIKAKEAIIKIQDRLNQVEESLRNGPNLLAPPPSHSADMEQKIQNLTLQVDLLTQSAREKEEREKATLPELTKEELAAHHPAVVDVAPPVVELEHRQTDQATLLPRDAAPHTDAPVYHDDTNVMPPPSQHSAAPASTPDRAHEDDFQMLETLLSDGKSFEATPDLKAKLGSPLVADLEAISKKTPPSFEALAVLFKQRLPTLLTLKAQDSKLLQIAGNFVAFRKVSDDVDPHSFDGLVKGIELGIQAEQPEQALEKIAKLPANAQQLLAPIREGLLAIQLKKRALARLKAHIIPPSAKPTQGA